MYEWRYLPDITYPFMRADDHGQPLFTMEALPSGLIVRRKLCEMQPVYAAQYPDQWAICMWEPPGDEDDWAAVYGTMENFPKQGVYIFHGESVTPLHLPGRPPTDATTSEFIAQIKRSRVRGKAGKLEDEQKQRKAFDHQADEAVGDLVEERMWPAFGNITPGQRGGSVLTQAGIGESPHLRKPNEVSQ